MYIHIQLTDSFLGEPVADMYVRIQLTDSFLGEPVADMYIRIQLTDTFLGEPVADMYIRIQLTDSSTIIVTPIASNHFPPFTAIGCTIVQHYYNGNVSFLWENGNFDRLPCKIRTLEDNLSGLITSTRRMFVPNLVTIRSRGTSGHTGEI